MPQRFLAPKLTRFGRSAFLVSALAVAFGQGLAQEVLAETGLSYYLAAKTEPIEGEPIPSTGIPEGSGWVADTYVTPAGIEVPIVRQRTPEVSVPLGAIQKVLVYQPPWNAALFPSSETVLTRLVIEDPCRDEFNRIARERQGYWLLVVSDGRSIDLDPVGVNLTDAVPGGTFDSETEALEFYASIANRVQMRATSEHQVGLWRHHFGASALVVLWHLKCDPEFRAAAQRDGYDVDEIVKQFGEQAADVDCTAEPELPRAP